MAMTDDIAYYATPGPMTRLDTLPDGALVGLPTDPTGIAEVVRGLVLHPFLAELYNVVVAEDHLDDVQIRPMGDVIGRLLDDDDRPLVEARAPEHRFSGNCRHFSTLTVALLRHAGVPSRARCGFGGYFQPGKWLDHWIVEHWDGERWVVLDAQIDRLQREVFGLAADPADLPPGHFLPAGEAWLACQAGIEDGDRFGILDEWGQWFIRGNVARDLAALNKVEMLPWDGWGDLATEDEPPGGDAYVDELAALIGSGDHTAIRQRYETDDGLRVPPRVTAFFTRHGPTDVDVPELA